MRDLGAALFIACAACAGCAPSPAPASSGTPAASSGDVSARVVKERCNGPPGGTVSEMTDAEGHVGGYMISGGVMDSPVVYLDEQGGALATFHVLSDPQLEERVPGELERRKKRFPNLRHIGC